LVDSYGLSQATIEAISEAAGVSPRTFWSYYHSKEDAVIDRHPDLPAAIQEAMRARPVGEDPLTSIREVLEDYMHEKITDSARSIRRQQLIRREPQLMAAVAAAFEELERSLVSAVADRMAVDPEEDICPAVLVSAACGAFRVAHYRWADDGGSRPFASLLDEAFGQLARGFRASVLANPGKDA
jgi:AcrR family transcriptional regulator